MIYLHWVDSFGFLDSFLSPFLYLGSVWTKLCTLKFFKEIHFYQIEYRERDKSGV